MRNRIKNIFDLLEKIHVAGPEVDIMFAIRREMLLLFRDIRFQELGGPGGGHPDPVGEPGHQGEPGQPEEARKENEDG